MKKTYLELAIGAVTALVTKGQIKYVPAKGEDWQSQNKNAIKTFGWAVVEMHRELSHAYSKSIAPPKGEEKPKSKLLVVQK